jgi:hypothetical protein
MVSCNIQYIKAKIVILLNRIDISRLKVTDAENNKDNIEIIIMRK